jgi:hypothetical protein
MEDIFNTQIGQEALERFQNLVVITFKNSVEREHLIGTRELQDSIKEGATIIGKDIISTSIHFSALLRIKDMKTLNYATLPPVNAMIRFVESHGVDKFAFVPGYKNGVRPVDSVAIRRIAAAITHHFKSTPNVKRGYRGIYNEEKWRILPLFFDELRRYAADYTQEFIRDSMGSDVVVLPIMQNVARKMASQNAYSDGKINKSKLHLNFTKNQSI